jgi:putative heme-binding domain-containing protein
VVLGVTANLTAQTPTQNPFASSDVAAGAKFFRSHCGRCHGRSGTGGRGPDLTQRRYRYATSDAELFQLISDGIPRAGMPPLLWPEAKETGAGEQIWQIVAFLRSLKQPTEFEPPGNPSKGKELYWGKGACNKCHMIDGVGGRQGPDLTDIGWLRSAEHMKASLVTPNEHVEPRWWSVRLRRQDGTVLDAIRMDEDTFSVRVLDGEDNLGAYQKDELREVKRITESSMPSYADTMSEQELDDMVAYLFYQRGRKK